MDLNTTQIECFLAAARYLSFTVAAEKMYMSQSTVSRQINMLETELGFRLFDRIKNEIRLSEPGKIMRDVFLKTNAMIDEAAEQGKRLSLNHQGKIDLMLFGNVMYDYLWEHGLADFLHQNDDVTLRITYTPDEEMSSPVGTGEPDLFFTHAFSTIDPESYCSHAIAQADRKLYIYREHPLAEKNCIKKGDLTNLEFLTIYPKRKFLDINKDIFSYYGVAKARIQTLDNMPTLSAYLISGNYAAIGDDMSFYLDERFKAIPFDEGINPITVYANWKKTNKNPMIKDVLEALK